ncbi:MAG TPA: hypothetical protein VGQ16_18250 [Vicinamibacterales bacterium]|jgi:hypothetical protein|nr:hypothetical protein [Vicinamibacterales bacterium]
MSRYLAAVIAAATLGGIAVACGSGTGGGTTPAPSPTPAAPINPCPTSTLQPLDVPTSVVPDEKTDGGLRDPDPRGTIFDVLWGHRARGPGLFGPSALTPQATATDIGDIAVIQDEGDLVAGVNIFDIRLTGLRFVPNASSGYDVVRIDPAFRTTLGDRVTLGDDDSAGRTLPFAFTFYGRSQTDAFVNSDGNVTFGEADSSSSDRNIARLLTGPPRVAPFLSDLDPSTGGSVFVSAGATAFTATWCGVRVFGSTRQATMQTSLLPNGTVEMTYSDSPPWTAMDGIVGMSPGHTGAFRPLDLSTTTTAPMDGGSAALGERFAQRPDLDLVSTARKFYESHPDAYDQLVVFTDLTLTFSAFSFEVTVANEVRGIGVDVYDTSREFGSAGRLRSMVQMDDIGKFPEDPTVKFLGENNTLSVVGQEVGHRWLAFLRFRDHNRQTSEALLGRDKAHWSFFFNSEASVMEGNRIQDLGGGSFRTIGAVEKYSLLDQYAMGLVRDFDVPPFWYVENPLNTQPFAQARSAPRIGVTFNGTRRDVLMNDVVDVLGPRQPSAAESPKVHRQAFLFVVGRGRTADPAAVAKIDRIRRAWEPFFSQATDGRARAETRLFPTS